MHRLEEQFSGRVEFFVLDVDKPESRPYFEEYAIRSRSTYVLLDGNGNELKRWVGPLSGDSVAVEMNEILQSLQ
ncbi:MAG: hypothetical protein DWQ04_04285 [Chloroflexi bacterium]|nr:MAG: hypothetical protein DWQ04_04285 [Chloroflexota bacterium]